MNVTNRALPSALKETSGLARSKRDPSLFWSHNDAGNSATLYALSSDGKLQATVKVEGARLEDWEDIESAPCASGNCLFIGDIGDNDARRSFVTIYRVAEPSRGATATAPVVAMNARYPDGPRDAEALFVLAGDVYVVTKGRTGPIELYRWPRNETSGTGVLVKLKELLPKPRSSGDRITSASASPDGKRVAIRTYDTLYIFSASSLVSGSSATEPLVTFDLSGLKEPKGEGLTLSDDGTVWLSSEAGGKSPPVIANLKCEMPNNFR